MRKRYIRFKEICSQAMNGKDSISKRRSFQMSTQKICEEAAGVAEALQASETSLEQKCERAFELVLGEKKKDEKQITLVNRGCVTSLRKRPSNIFMPTEGKGAYTTVSWLCDVPNQGDRSLF